MTLSPKEIKWSTILMIGLFLFFSFLAFGGYSLLFNEGIYLIQSRQIVDPTFLAADWYVGNNAGNAHGLLFSILVAPLWKLGLNAIEVALCIRVVETFALLSATIMLLRSLELPLKPGLLGLSLWVIAGQFGVAGEWVIGGAEQKPFAYVAVLFAIIAAIKSRWLWMSLCLSIGIWLHILVGGWSALALFGALLFRRELISRKQLIRSGLLVAVIVAPTLILSIYALQTPGAIATPLPPYSSLGQMMTEFQVPHHFNPTVFLTAKTLAKFCLITLGFYLSIFTLSVSPRTKSLLATFSTNTLLIFGIGLVAFFLKQYKVLTFYPFRLADGVLPLFCFTLLPIVVFEGTKSFSTLRIQQKRTLILSIVICFALFLGSLDNIMRHSKLTLNSWAEILQLKDQDSKYGLYQWVRDNTNEQSTFLVPPEWHDFLLIAQRPAFVLMQALPQNQRAWEWFDRVQQANNSQAFNGHGYAAYKELQQNYPLIQKRKLDALASEYNVKFYVVDFPRQDLQESLVVSIEGYYVYDISAIQARS